jgi:ATP-dependent RNA helicase DDX18/HAS1
VQPSEIEFVDALRTANVPVEEFDFPKKKLLNIQAQVEKLVAKNFELHTLARDGFRLAVLFLSPSLVAIVMINYGPCC